jgi:hypothetical protein
MTEQLDLANIKDRISQLLSEYRIPSAAIGILHDGTKPSAILVKTSMCMSVCSANRHV